MMFFTVKSLREATLDLRCSLEFPESRKINDEDGGSRKKNTNVCVCVAAAASITLPAAPGQKQNKTVETQLQHPAGKFRITCQH